MWGGSWTDFFYMLVDDRQELNSKYWAGFSWKLANFPSQYLSCLLGRYLKDELRTGELQGFQLSGETVHPGCRDIHASRWEICGEFPSVMSLNSFYCTTDLRLKVTGPLSSTAQFELLWSWCWSSSGQCRLQLAQEYHSCYAEALY